MTNDTLNWQALQDAKVVMQPFPHLLVADMLAPQQAETVRQDFPRIDSAGSFPCEALQYGPAFARLLDEVRSERLRDLLADKFDLLLVDARAMVTVRGQCRATDGQIHTDSKGKLITVLIYMNDTWETSRGRLRLLNSASNLDDYFLEAPASCGAMVAFVCTPNAWHGHSEFSGQRRSIQLNWVAGSGYLLRERLRHRLSASLKKIRRAAGKLPSVS